MSARRLPPRLLALTPGDLGPPAIAPFLERLRRAIEGGLRGVLVREPALSEREFERLARSVRDALAPCGGWLGIHDRAHFALALGADALHVGFRSLPPAAARDLLGPGPSLGLSAHAGDDPHAWLAADYLFFGPVFETPSKQGWRGPVGLAGLADAVGSSAVPVWAIGGITPERAREVLAAGARGVAVRAALLGAGDPREAALRFEASLADTIPGR